MLDNINPKLWGPKFWPMLHYVTLAYPNDPSDDDKNDMRNFFITFQNVIPCEKCRKHFKNHLEIFPLDANTLSSKTQLMTWLVNMHNAVNAMLGKKKVDVDDMINKYAHGEMDDNTYDVKIITTILLSVLIVVIIMYIKLR